MMEKDTAAHRRHRPGPGAPPSGGAPRHLKAASEMVELQRSRSVGGLLQKGDPLRCVKKLSRELGGQEGRGHGKRGGQSLSGNLGASRTRSAVSPQGRQTGHGPARAPRSSASPGKVTQRAALFEVRTLEMKPRSLYHPHLFGFHSQKPSVFVEIDLGDHAEEVVTGTMKEEKQSEMDMGGSSEDE
ncbi:Hypothetical predicted protein [Lynx pardinus]|uniref:Uncharacterized protein n=1 Tax=Lynx pardinus TaxID=191816 RepID=A0A485NZU7_LYNPA|nr:Hypothetical predicted protein [Lynx pardinus]